MKIRYLLGYRLRNELRGYMTRYRLGESVKVLSLPGFPTGKIDRIFYNGRTLSYRLALSNGREHWTTQNHLTRIH